MWCMLLADAKVRPLAIDERKRLDEARALASVLILADICRGSA